MANPGDATGVPILSDLEAFTGPRLGAAFCLLVFLNRIFGAGPHDDKRSVVNLR